MKPFAWITSAIALVLAVGTIGESGDCFRRCRSQRRVTYSVPCRPAAAAATNVLPEPTTVNKPVDSENPNLSKVPESDKRWYKIEVHTAADEKGGTDSDVALRFASDLGRSDWYYLKSDVGSHQGGDVDLYYFYGNALGKPTEMELAMKKAGDDSEWSQELWLFELEGTEWKEVFHESKKTITPESAAKEFPADADRIVPECSCHISADKNAPRYPSGTTWPPGVEICEPSK